MPNKAPWYTLHVQYLGLETPWKILVRDMRGDLQDLVVSKLFRGDYIFPSNVKLTCQTSKCFVLSYV